MFGIGNNITLSSPNEIFVSIKAKRQNGHFQTDENIATKMM